MSSSNYKILKLHKKIDNRLCADCRAPLGDANNCFASLTFQVWICGDCSEVHKQQVDEIDSRLKSIHDQWSDDEILRMEKAKSNAMVNKVFERFIPPEWQRIDVNSGMVERKTWIRAKYFSMYFALPQHDVLPTSTKGKGPKPLPISRDNRIVMDKSLPTRMIDFFITVSLGKSQHRSAAEGRVGAAHSHGGKISLDSVQFHPSISCCYPDEKQYPDTPIPDLIGPIVFPNGLCLSSSEKPPFCFSFVMTNINRVKLYGTALIVYELVDPEFLKTLLSVEETAALLHPNKHDHSQVFYAPKALTLISHYGFFQLYSRFLEQIYHVSLSSAPLPLERYIANFVLEVPLPPQGRTEVFITLPESMLQISRPPRNYLPMVDFSFRPLFVSLSVENILSVFNCLCAEMTVCICSSNIALLTPVQEALLSLLFPFVWQGCYVPVLPAHMMELLDAPVPLLVGVHDSYLLNTPEQYRPKTVVFVHLDTDTVIFGKGDDFFGERVILPLPKQSTLKLKKKLVEHGECIYRHPVEMQRLKRAGFPFPSNEHLVPIAAFISEQGVTTQHQHSMSKSEMLSSLSKMGVKRMPGTIHEGNGVPYRHPVACTLDASSGGSIALMSSKNKVPAVALSSILDPANNCEEGNAPASTQLPSFNAKEIREAFLRFFVASFIDYQEHFQKVETAPGSDTKKPQHGLFLKRRDTMQTKFAATDMLRFNKDAYVESVSDPFLKQMIETQMFSNYISERIDCPEQAEIRFFDENILAKANRSKLSLHKSSTPFLSDDTDNISESFTVPGPSNSGIAVDHMFSYPHFPTLSEKLVGVVRVPKLLVSEPEIKRVQGQSAVLIREQLLLKARQSSVSPTTGLDDTTAENGAEDTNYDQDTESELNTILLAARRRFALVTRAVLVTQSLFRMRPKRRWYLQMRRAFECMRRFVRMTSLRRTIMRRVASKAVVVVQKYWRTAVAKQRFKKYLHVILFLQSCYRGRKLRKRYLQVRRVLLRLQGLFRGCKTRKSQKKQLVAQISAYRAQVICLWELENTSLSQRSSVWRVLTQPTYLHVAVLRDELLRLYDSLGVHTTDCPFFAAKSRSARFEDKFFLVDKSVIVAKLRLLSSSGTSLALLRKELDYALSQCSSAPGKAVCARLTSLKALLQKERQHLYETLKAREKSSEGVSLKDDVFRLFALPDSKKRKQRLLDSVWSSCSEGHAAISAQVVQRIQQSPASLDTRGSDVVVDFAQNCVQAKMALDNTHVARAGFLAIQRNRRPKFMMI